MAYVLDIALMAILVLFFVRGWQKGFAAGLVNLVGSLAALVLAFIVGDLAANWAYGAFIRQPLAERIAAQLAGTTPGEAEIRTLLDSFPAFIERALAHYGITAQSLAAGLGNSTDVSWALADAISPLIITILKFLIIVLLFFAFMMAVRFVSGMVCSLFELPLIRQLNQALGGVFGLLKGLLVVWLVCASLNLLVPMMKNSVQEATQKSIQSSVLFDLIYEHNPIYDLL